MARLGGINIKKTEELIWIMRFCTKVQKRKVRFTFVWNIIPESISADYCDLKCYGIKIEKTTVYAGGGKIVESKQINNIFYRYKDATEFSDTIIKKRIEPQGLRDIVENYIIESIDRARQSA